MVSIKEKLEDLYYKRQYGGKTKTPPKSISYKKGVKTKISQNVRRKIIDRKVKTKKKINFVVRVYIDEDYSKYKKREYTVSKDASFYTKDANGKYRQHTKQYKLFTQRAFFMRGNTKNIRPFLNREVFGFDQRDLNNFRIAISKYDGGDELNTSIKSWMSLIDYLMFVVEDVSYSDPFESNEIDYPTHLANDDNAIPFQSKYITFDYVDGKMVVPYSTDYIKENFIYRACWYSVIIDTFKNSWDSWYKNNPLTYSFLYKLFHGVEMEDNCDMSLNFDTVVNKFFKPYKIGVVLFDVNYLIRCKYLPRDNGLSRNKHITPNVLYVMLHQKHITRINKDLNSLTKKLDVFEKEVQLEVRPTFTLPKEKDNRTFRVIDNVDDIIKVITEGEDDYIEVIYNQDLMVLWREIRDNIDFEMEIHFVGNTISSLKYEDLKKTILIKDVYSMDAGQLFFDNETEYVNFVNSKNTFSTKLLNKNYLSRYSENVNQVFHTYTRGGVIGGFDTSVDDYNLLALDYNKYYTKQLMNMPYIPVINSFDNFVEYKGEDIEEMNLYIYEKLDDELTYPLQRQGIIYGFNIKRRNPNVKLIAVLQPNTLKENKTKLFINELYDNDEIDLDVKKFIVNQTIGMTNKKFNKKYYSRAFTNKEDAVSNYTKYGGGLFEHYLYTLDELNKDIYDSTDEKIYFHYCHQKVELEEGFYPIGLFILDSAEAELFDLVDKARLQGMKVYGVNTDCVYVDKVIGDFDLGNKIGQLKIEKKEMISFNKLTIKENTSIWKFPDNLNINVIDIENEWNKEEIKSKLVNKTILQAVETAGAGKTTALKQLEKTLFVIPFNAQREDLENDDKKVVTLYQLLGLRLNDQHEVENCIKGYDIIPYDNIVFDEIFLHTVRDLEKIKYFMKRHHTKNYYATGDIDQLPPIEYLNNVRDVKQYYKDIVYSLFPNHIYLYENKRFTKQEDREKLKKITKTFLYGTREERIRCIYDNFKVVKTLPDLKTKKNLSAYNRTIDRVNNHFSKGFTVGQKIICRKPILRKGCRTFVNYIYIIEELGSTVKLSHGKDCVIIDKKELDCFRPAFCQTVHSVQGLTIKEPFTIFDALSPMATGEWLNTAFTRATDFNDITFFITNYDFYSELTSVISQRLQQLKEDDKMKNRDFDLDSNWVYNEIKNCGWRCKMCKSSLDVFGNEAFSIDRVDNNLGHIKMNCQILCRRCNVSKK